MAKIKKKPMAVTFLFDVKTVRKCIAVTSGEVLSDTEINKTYFDAKPLVIDVEKTYPEENVIEMALPFVMMIKNREEIEKQINQKK